MKRAMAGVLAGYAAWTVVWLAGNALFFGAAAEAAREGTPVTDAGTLAGLLVLAASASLLAGFLAALLGGERKRGTALLLGALLLLTGILVQAGVRSLMPAWYHIAFLIHLVPFVLLGAMAARRKG